MRSVASAVVKATAAAWDAVRRPRDGVVVLLYHRVGAGTGASVDLDDALFAAQLDLLKEQSSASSLDDAVTRLQDAAPNGSSVVVTFDDGTADFVDHALPALAERGVPATIYLTTAFVEDGRSFPDGSKALSWSALRDAISTGLVTVGSHTHTHRLLDRAEPAVIDEELDRSRALVEERLGVAARHFAYPKARPGSIAAEAAVRHRFASAALAGTHANPYGATDVYRLARSPVQQSDGLRWFARKLQGGMALEDQLRGVLDRRRYANDVT
jgi:peptidoglycan/xylan/chitin deacetylase (PgdA/CDA1 family)